MATGGDWSRHRCQDQPTLRSWRDTRIEDDDRTAEVTDLLAAADPQRVRQRRHAPSPATRSAAPTCWRSYLGGLVGSTSRRSSREPGGRASSRGIEGSDPHAPTLLLMGHTDVVPVNPDGWERDPFGGELVDGEVWGRGAVDMLNLTASMAVGDARPRQLGLPPDGTLVYLAVADEEALGTYGAEWLADHARRRGRCRLRDHRVRRHPDPDAVGPEAARHRRREGHRLVPPAGARARPATVRSRSAPTTRW